MGFDWTPEQRKVIESRGGNLLVSAAAGSGKTAVLVERIIRMVTDEDSPIDIDRLLVMTFTKAAASEMRERVAAAIEERLKDCPGDEHLQAQAALVEYAQITTIDSFCLKLVREHFNSLDIDPGFRTGDEGEMMLMRADAMKELLEAHYESGEDEFERFVETYAHGKGDGGIEDYILQVYFFSQSTPFPKLWFESCKSELKEDDLSQMSDAPWMKFLLLDCAMQAEELAIQTEEAMAVCGEDSGPAAYLPMLAADRELLEDIKKAGNYEELSRVLAGASFDRLSPVRGKDIDPEKKAYVAACRDRVKKAVAKLKENYCFESPENVLADLLGCRGSISTLLSMAEEFSDRYQAKKREKNVVDFNDMEHFALSILTEREGEGWMPTAVADELSRQYEEILVDEYQDSNEVQETLIKSISRERYGRPNVFMVGDVKQSIYQFRLARPELFMEKYESYPEVPGPYQKIELHQNFRSRETVLDGINSVFYKIMTKNLGNIEYTDKAALHPGALYPDTEEKAGGPIELLMVNTNGDLLKALDEDVADFTSRELEARMIARRIQEMTDGEAGLSVWDKSMGAYRKARYSDMVILLRSFTGWAEIFLNVLLGEGIPVYAESRTGYFNTVEVETMLSLLAVIDNPMQDIPLAAVLRSPIAGLSDAELAHMMAVYRKTADKGQDRGMYGAFRLYLGLAEIPDKALWEKLSKADELFSSLRFKSTYMGIHELLYEIFSKTGYYGCVSAMPAGETRRANLDMLAQKAADYEKTSYKGLFHFIRYIEGLKKYDTDFGEASAAGGHGDTVCMMSIHKSKGLEFPIVFLAGLGKSFNKRDVYGRILIDPVLGIGTDYLDLELRVKGPTLKKNALKRKADLDTMGEELRVLYVAMTRAKEKLVMTATDKYLDRKLERWRQLPPTGGQVPFTILSSASSCLDWLLMSQYAGRGRLDIREVPVTEIVGEEIGRQIKMKVSEEELLCFDTEAVYDEEFQRELEQTFTYRYPHEADISLHTKMSVSELKTQGQMADEEESVILPTYPQFLLEEETVTGGATRGTAYHRVLELLDFSAADSRDFVQRAVQGLVENRKISAQHAALTDSGVLWNFISSPLGRRMAAAQNEGRLHRERQFVMGIPARQMELCDSDELVVIQGIIDAYLEEDGKLVLVDYKTDRIAKGQEEKLAAHYRRQLIYYQKALEQITGKKVREKFIYSLALQKAIEITEVDENERD